MGTAATEKAPRTLRVEVMPLDCGETAVVIELATAPGRAWEKALKRVLAESEALESAQARCDGRFVYVIGIEPGSRGVVQQVNQLLAATHDRIAPRSGSPQPPPPQPGSRQASASL